MSDWVAEKLHVPKQQIAVAIEFIEECAYCGKQFRVPEIDGQNPKAVKGSLLSYDVEVHH